MTALRAAGVLVTVAALWAVAAPARAHHSYGATYDVSREIRLEGKLVQFVFRNPHTFVHVQAPDESGVTQRWAVEWSGTAQLANNGITRDTLHVGDAVVIVGPAVARAERVPRADGQPEAAERRLQLGHAAGRSGRLTSRRWPAPPSR